MASQKKIFRDLEKYGIKTHDKIMSIAMTKDTNLDHNTKVTQLNIESLARTERVARRTRKKY